MTTERDNGVTRRQVITRSHRCGTRAFIIGSGMTFHNLRAFRDPRAQPVAEQFDAWLRVAATAEPTERDQQLTRWAEAPAARAAHPREEHLIPLMVIAGAAGDDRGTIPYNGTFGGLRLSAYHYG